METGNRQRSDHRCHLIAYFVKTCQTAPCAGSLACAAAIIRLSLIPAYYTYTLRVTWQPAACAALSGVEQACTGRCMASKPANAQMCCALRGSVAATVTAATDSTAHAISTVSAAVAASFCASCFAAAPLPVRLRRPRRLARAPPPPPRPYACGMLRLRPSGTVETTEQTECTSMPCTLALLAS
jgi:hypothetical protein